MSAGLYTFAIEEFGKLLLLKKCIIQTGICSIPYRDGFVDHSYKAKVAFDYLQENHADECISLTRNGFSTSGFNWRGFEMGLLADFKSRSSIFYSDVILNENNEVIGIASFPKVQEDLLISAINKIKTVVVHYQMSSFKVEEICDSSYTNYILVIFRVIQKSKSYYII